MSAQIHISLRFDKQNLPAGDSSLADQGFEFNFIDFDAVFLCKQVYGYESHIVTGILVFFSGIAQTYDYIHEIAVLSLCFFNQTVH